MCLFSVQGGFLLLVADHPQKLVALLYVLWTFDAFGRDAVDDAQDTAPLFSLGDDRLNGV
jgi:hypothetical protein